MTVLQKDKANPVDPDTMGDGRELSILYLIFIFEDQNHCEGFTNVLSIVSVINMLPGPPHPQPKIWDSYCLKALYLRYLWRSRLLPGWNIEYGFFSSIAVYFRVQSLNPRNFGFIIHLVRTQRFSEKLNISYPLRRTCTCADQLVRNVSLENFAYVPYKSFL